MDRRRVPVLDPPCSRQGLPPPHVAVSRCALLPHSFHLFRFTPVVSFLWHFPYNYLRSPLATVVALCCPDFPLVTRLFETHHQRPFSDLALLFYHFSKNFSRDFFANFAKLILICGSFSSKIWFTRASALLLYSLWTWRNLTLSNVNINCLISW